MSKLLAWLRRPTKRNRRVDEFLIQLAARGEVRERWIHWYFSHDSIHGALHGQPYIRSMEWLVWRMAHVMVESLFSAGHTVVIIDACNASQQRIDEWQDDRWQVEIEQVVTDKSTCLQRLAADGSILPGTRIALEETIERMDASLYGS